MNDSSMIRALTRLSFLVTAVILVTVLYFAKVLFLPLAFAILFAFLLAPVVTSLERLHVPSPIAALLVILGFTAVLASAGWGLFTQLIAVTNDLPTYGQNISKKMAEIHSPSDSAFSRAQNEIQRLAQDFVGANSALVSGVHPDGNSDERPLGSTPERPIQVREVAKQPGRLDQIGGIFAPLTTAFLSVVLTFFVLLQRKDLRNRLIRLTGDRNLRVTTQAMNDASSRISHYFFLQLLVNLTYGTVVFAALYFIGLPHAFLFAALAALGRFLPYIGAPIGALAPTLLSLAVFPGWSRSLLIVCIFLCLEIATANFVEPRMYGRHTGLSSLAILIAAAFWTLIWGPIGLALSVPLTVCLVVIGQNVPSLEFLSVLLGDQPVMPLCTCFYQRLIARDKREAGEILEASLKDSKLEDVYDSIMIPALVMSEEDRMYRDMEDSTVAFIHHTASQLIEECGFRENPVPANVVELPQSGPDATAAIRVMCIPVLDDTDQLAATMLAQCIDGGHIQATAAPVRRVTEMLASVAEEDPDIVVLSGLPPFGVARSQRLYKSLRTRHPNLKIVIGILNYPDDAAEVAQKISGGEENRVIVKLSEAVAEVHSYAENGASACDTTPSAALAL